ncbi:acyl-CoA dehydrogenase family protein [Cryptosporangium aurantiacum]|uniref:Acyl-CoA dehydrogenase n=1 Tax=Cryptosporangium aurantiacum TaxID=134849 RepID=A0A1M7PI17_9ACTN|nr:acyl-CoA dehydrogenase family protein [Cryptosporangium aurantiacum]SHN16808.1 Acyl-CoA dehydrogenase [Cryptosporangium aurantiacum]
MLSLTDEQVSLAEAVQGWASAHDFLAAAREHPGAPVSVRESAASAAELGLLGILLPDGGGSPADLAVVVAELGRAGANSPVGEAAAAVAAFSGDLDAGGLESGATLLVPAVGNPEQRGIEAKPDGSGGLVLTGHLASVTGAGAAHWLLVAADGEAGPALALVPASASGVTVTPRVTLDITREFSSVDLDGVVASAWTPDTGLLFDTLAAYAVMDAVGAAGALLEKSVGYVKEREQFGQVVGRFQAVKHHAATMATEWEAAYSITRAAVLALDDGDAAARAHAVSVAAAYAKPACSRIAGTAIQLHGGMGFTWEHDVHVLVRRVKTDELVLGTPRWHRERLARLLSA